MNRSHKAQKAINSFIEARMARRKPAEIPQVFETDKEQVKSIYKESVIRKEKKGFVAMSSGGINGKALHSGIAKTESNAWKLAAHNL